MNHTSTNSYPGISAENAAFIDEHWPAFAARVQQRLCAGAKEYGDGSLSRSLPWLIEEIRQELRDVAGWAAIMDYRLEQMLKSANCAEQLAEISAPGLRHE